MKLGEMRHILDSRQIQLTKSLGQNFLHDQNQLEKIVAAAELDSNDSVLEVGPGLGPLTAALVEKSKHVLAIETDARLCRFLEERFEGRQNLELVHADAVKYLRERPRDWTDWKLVSNLPYSIASVLLVDLAKAATSPKRVVATLQIEVAERLAAKAGDAEYGLLSLLIQLRYVPLSQFRIPPGSFFPAPEVDSACVVLERRSADMLDESERKIFYPMIKQAFSQRRKMMMKLLKQTWSAPRLEAAFAEAGVGLTFRAEQASLEQFVSMAKTLAQNPIV